VDLKDYFLFAPTGNSNFGWDCDFWDSATVNHFPFWSSESLTFAKQPRETLQDRLSSVVVGNEHFGRNLRVFYVSVGIILGYLLRIVVELIAGVSSP